MRPTLMLLPGLMCDAAVWAPQVAALPAQCVVPAWGLRDSLSAMAQQVLEEAPTERFSLAGHSMGGRVALEIMRLAPQRVERLALLDTGTQHPLPAGEAVTKSGQGAWLSWNWPAPRACAPWQISGRAAWSTRINSTPRCSNRSWT